MASAYKTVRTVRTATTADGKTVRMDRGVWGKGRSRTEKYQIFVDGVQVDYAVNARDADENFARAVLTGKGRVG